MTDNVVRQNDGLSSNIRSRASTCLDYRVNITCKDRYRFQNRRINKCLKPSDGVFFKKRPLGFSVIIQRDNNDMFSFNEHMIESDIQVVWSIGTLISDENTQRPKLHEIELSVLYNDNKGYIKDKNNNVILRYSLTTSKVTKEYICTLIPTKHSTKTVLPTVITDDRSWKVGKTNPPLWIIARISNKQSPEIIQECFGQIYFYQDVRYCHEQNVQVINVLENCGSVLTISRLFNVINSQWKFILKHSLMETIYWCISNYPQEFQKIRIGENMGFLHYVSYHGMKYYHATKLLLSKLGMVDWWIDDFGYTPLYIAVTMNHFFFVDLFLSYGCPMSIYIPTREKYMEPQNVVCEFDKFMKCYIQSHFKIDSCCIMNARYISSIQQKDTLPSLGTITKQEGQNKKKRKSDFSDTNLQRKGQDSNKKKHKKSRQVTLLNSFLENQQQQVDYHYTTQYQGFREDLSSLLELQLLDGTVIPASDCLEYKEPPIELSFPYSEDFILSS